MLLHGPRTLNTRGTPQSPYNWKSRVQVAEELALALAEMQFVCAYWLLYLVPHTQKWPANVERNVRGLLRKVRVLSSGREGVSCAFKVVERYGCMASSERTSLIEFIVRCADVVQQLEKPRFGVP